MKNQRKIRFFAFILTLCMAIGALPLYVLADGTETELPEQITETTNENLTAFQLGLGEKSVAELENMTLLAADIPASISRETIRMAAVSQCIIGYDKYYTSDKIVR